MDKLVSLKKKLLKNKKKSVLFISLILVVLCLVLFAMPRFFVVSYVINLVQNTSTSTPPEIIPEKPKVTHVKTPEQVKAIYMTSWVAGTTDFRKSLVKIIDETEINSIVIDIKDYTGVVAFKVNDPALKNVVSKEIRSGDLREFIQTLHDKNIYVIGRISAFQDAYFVKQRPDLAVKKSSDGGVWKDRKGISWIDPGSKEMWDYLIAIGKESYEAGFDELNYDYLRFPSDGNMNDIYYPFSQGKPKSEVLKSFFEYLTTNLRNEISEAVLSADLFGMTTTNSDDLGIGQILENTLLYFDYVAPMVYPSHYPTGFNGWKSPVSMPYEVISFSMKRAVERANLASTTPLKLRPWLQDFSLGTKYTPDMVKAQIKATYDVGLTSWMLWNASNVYTRSALLPE